MRKEIMTSVGVIVAALLAATCCIGPVLFGASFAFLGKLSFMEAFRPYFLGLAGLMVGYSFWKLYLKKPDCACPADVRIRKVSRWVFWVGPAISVRWRSKNRWGKSLGSKTSRSPSRIRRRGSPWMML